MKDAVVVLLVVLSEREERGTKWNGIEKVVERV
jgi:hypothetical protein